MKFNLKKHLKNHENSKRIFFNFNNFKKKIKRIFEMFNEKQNMKKIIQHLTQKTSALNYIVKFQKYINFTK